MSKPYTEKYTPRTKSFNNFCDTCKCHKRNCSCDSRFDDDDVLFDQDGALVSKTFQGSEELIIIKDSCDITVTTVDTQTASTIQAGVQTAILTAAIIIIEDINEANIFAQTLIEKATTKQVNRQKLLIEGSQGVTVTTTDTDTASTIQALVQTLTAIAAIILDSPL